MRWWISKFSTLGHRGTASSPGLWDTAPMNHGVVAQALCRDGAAILFGSIAWPRPYFPTTTERAQIVAELIPSWAIATGSTAAWVWTGCGQPEPWSVLRRPSPAVSPLDRTQWRALARNPAHHRVVTIGALTLLNRRDTAREVSCGPGSVDVASAQVFLLLDAEMSQKDLRERRTTQRERDHATRVLDRVATLRALYPDITR